LAFDVHDLPCTSHGMSVHKGVIVCWDEDHDTRVLGFIDDLDPFDCEGEKLIAVHESKGCLYMLWERCVPIMYANGRCVSLVNDSDSWVINSSRALTPRTARTANAQGGAA